MPTASPSTASRSLIGHTIEANLMDVVDGLATGRLELADCTPAIIALFTLGESLSPLGERIRQLEQELAQARRDADRYYLAAFNPAERAEHIRNRMDAALKAGIHTTDFDQFEAMLSAVLTPATKEAE